MSTESITLTRDTDEWIATDDQTGAEGRGPTREAALEELDEQRRHDPVQIVKTPDVLGGKPRLDGTRIGVFTIGESIREGDQSIEGILEGYPGLSRAQVEATLAYYDAHPEAMDVIRTQREATKYRLQAQSRASGTDHPETGA